jgi:hypothetical protein
MIENDMTVSSENEIHCPFVADVGDHHYPPTPLAPECEVDTLNVDRFVCYCSVKKKDYKSAKLYRQHIKSARHLNFIGEPSPQAKPRASGNQNLFLKRYLIFYDN